MTRIPLTGHPEVDRLLLQSVVQFRLLHPWVVRSVERTRRRCRREVAAAKRAARRGRRAIEARIASLLEQVGKVD